MRWRSRVSCSWLLSAVSSSLSDCSSSFEVSSSSLVDWYSSLTDSASSLIAFCSSAADLEVADRARSSVAGGLQFLFQLGDPGGRHRRAGGVRRSGSRGGSRRSRPAAGPRRRRGRAARDVEGVPSRRRRATPRATTIVFSARLLDGGRAAWCAGRAGAMASRSWVGWPGAHAQIAVGRAQRIQALVLAVDQDRGGRIGLEHQPAAQFGERGLARRRRRVALRPRRTARAVGAA